MKCTDFQPQNASAQTALIKMDLNLTDLSYIKSQRGTVCLLCFLKKGLLAYINYYFLVNDKTALLNIYKSSDTPAIQFITAILIN